MTCMIMFAVTVLEDAESAERWKAPGLDSYGDCVEAEHVDGRVW